MILRYLGHDLFTLTLTDGTLIVTDPYQGLYQYPDRTIAADICTVSHHHADHDSVSILQGDPIIIDTEGIHHPKNGICITGISTFHDEAQGAKRGTNLVFVIEVEGLRFVHLGDLGHLLSPAQISAIGQPDILFLPVGGNYTIDAKTALCVMQSLSPKVTIPMHYRTHACETMPIAPLTDFLGLLPTPPPAPLALCRITAEDIAERPPCLVMVTPEGY